MPDEYREMYLHLFNAVSDALGLLERGCVSDAGELLKKAQCECEELYMSSGGAGEDE